MSRFDVKMNELADAIKGKNTSVSGKLSVQGMIDAVGGIEVGGGGDTSDATVAAADVRQDKVFYGANGRDVGTMPELVASPIIIEEAGSHALGNGYYEDCTIEIGSDTLDEMNIRAGVNVMGVDGTFSAAATATDADILEGKTAAVNGKMVTGKLKVGSGDSTVKFGYWTEDGKFQELDLSGDSPVDSGTPAAVNAVTFNTGKPVPEYGGGGGIDFYECTSYTPDFAGGMQYSIILSGADDAAANGTYIRKAWVENPPDEWSDDPIAVWEKDNGYTIKEYCYSEYNYGVYNASGSSIYSSNEPYWSRVTDYNDIVWADSDWNDVTLTFTDGVPTEIPPTTEAWSGRKVVQDTETGLWSRTDQYQENMTAPFFTPEVGKVYSEDTSIACSAVFNEAAQNLVALYRFDGNYIDTAGKTMATLTEKYIEKEGKFDGCMTGDSYNAEMADSSYYMTIMGLPEMDAFTVEWWQKDDDNYGDGGAFMWQPQEDGKARSTFATVSIPKEDSRYITGKWKHLAFVREAGSGIVTQYLNGKNVGTISYAAKLGGRTVKFTGLTAQTGQAKTVKVDELAIYSVAKYTSDFTPSNSPIVI